MKVLLDFDGVVLPRHPLFSNVKHRVNRYVEKKLGLKSPTKIQEINEQLYQSYGHTVLGLRGIGCFAPTREFNQYVYDFIEHPAFENLERDAKELRALLNACDGRSIGVYVFSNAPDAWVRPFLERMRIGSRVKTLSDVIGDSLKPETSCYDRVEAFFGEEKLVYVDDKLCNLIPVANRDRWIPVLFSSSPQDARVLSIANRFSMIESLSDLTDSTSLA